MELFSYSQYIESEEFEPLFREDTNLTQIEEQTYSVDEHAEDDNSQRPRRAKNFSEKEDILLVSCWLEVAFDPAIGSQQTCSTFWGRIHDMYMQNSDNDQKRTKTSLEHRWSVIQDSVNKFCGCHDKVDRLNRSGTNDDDKLVEARNLYKETYKKKFNMQHCWDLLRDKPKWRAQHRIFRPSRQSTGSQSTSFSVSDNPGTNSSVNLDDCSPSTACTVRPPGKKAEKKRQRKGGQTKQYQQVLDDLSTGRRESEASRKTRHEEAMKVAVARHEAAMKIEAARHKEAMRLETEKLRLKDKKLKIEDERNAREARREDERIMTLNLDGIDKDTKEFYLELRRQIILKRRHTP